MWLMQAPATCTITVYLNMCISNHIFTKIDVRSLYRCIMISYGGIFIAQAFLRKVYITRKCLMCISVFFLNLKQGY